jgi:hypothetical protein
MKVFSLLVVLLMPCIAMRVKHGSMYTTSSTAAESKAAEAPSGDVDFSFMTSDMSYPGHEAGFFGTISEWFGGRSVSDELREEIVSGHTCSKKGSRDETYYATSFCYWLPEIQASDGRRSPGAGLKWIGGAYSKHEYGKEQCHMSGSGKCLKCSICHNNARDEDGQVGKTQFAEELPLSGDCLKEKHIDSMCVASYDSKTADLKRAYERCHSVEDSYNEANAEWQECLDKLESLPRRINVDLPNEIQAAKNTVRRREDELRIEEKQRDYIQDRMQDKCEDYHRERQNDMFWDRMLGAPSTEHLLNHLNLYCSYPNQPIDNGDGSFYDERIRYNNNLRVYQACKRCDDAKDDLSKQHNKVVHAESLLRSARAKEPQLYDELQRTKKELVTWQQRRPGLQVQKEAKDAEWLPQQKTCEDIYQEYDNGKASYVSACAPKYWEQSCEKECVEAQAKHFGCGVIEGASGNDEVGLGGLKLTCSPPQPSWVRAPFTYGASEDQSEQCNRITANQKPRYAQSILKAGWLWKKGRGLFGWDKRYFVFESGDQVRSAVMRYFLEEPVKTGLGDWSNIEREDKGIVVWDAKSVKAKSGEHYGFKDGSECFKLYHFYRDYRLCVPGHEGITSRELRQVAEDRNEWISLLEEAIRFPQ